MNDASLVQVGGIQGERLQSFFERIERLQTEKQDIQLGIKDVFSEAKGSGFDTKIMRAVLRLRKLSEPDRQEMDSLMDLYRHATGT